MTGVKKIIIQPNLKDLSNNITFDEIEKVYLDSNGKAKTIGIFESLKKLFLYFNKNGNGSKDYISEGETIDKSQLEKTLASMRYQPVDPSQTVFSYFGTHGHKVVYLHKNIAMVSVPPELVRVGKDDLTQDGTAYFYNKIKIKI